VLWKFSPDTPISPVKEESTSAEKEAMVFGRTGGM
jgi:hypothetical protein